MKNGFSLIELLLVLGLVALLATFAYPSYDKHLVRARRLDGQSALFDLAARLEAYHSQNGTYQTVPLTTNTSPLGYYRLSIVRTTQNEYQIAAHALGAQAKKDSLCAYLTLDSFGHQTHKSCWLPMLT